MTTILLLSSKKIMSWFCLIHCSFHDYKTIFKIRMTPPSSPPCPTPTRRPTGYPTTPTTVSPGPLLKTLSVLKVQIPSWPTAAACRSRARPATGRRTGALKCKLSARVSGKWPWMGHCLTLWNQCEAAEILSVVRMGTVLRCMTGKIIAKEVKVKNAHVMQRVSVKMTLLTRFNLGAKWLICMFLTGHSLGRGDNNGQYLKDLEDQIAEKKERRKREVESQQDWWEKRKDPPFTVKMPNRPHPSQVKIT